MPRVGSSSRSTSGVLVQEACDRDLLLVAARELARALVRRSAARCPGARSTGPRCGRARRAGSSPCSRRARALGQGRVLRDRETERESLGLAILAQTSPTPAASACARRPASRGAGRSVSRLPALTHRIECEQGAHVAPCGPHPPTRRCRGSRRCAGRSVAERGSRSPRSARRLPGARCRRAVCSTRG